MHNSFEIKLQPGCSEAYVLALNVPKYNMTVQVLQQLGLQQDINTFDPKVKIDVPYWLKWENTTHIQIKVFLLKEAKFKLLFR